MNKTFRNYSAFGWDFEICFPHSDDEGEWTKTISRPDDRGTGSIYVEEGSQLWNELQVALTDHEGYDAFTSDTYEEIKNDSYDTYDDYEDGFDDALAARDDEMGQ